MVSNTKKCPFCSEEILETAIKCKHCKSDLIENKKNSFKERMRTIEREDNRKKREREEWLKTLSPKELKSEKKKQVLINFATAVIVLIIFGTWGYLGLDIFNDWGNKSGGTSTSSNSNDGDVAAVCAQRYIKLLLKSPSSAKFPWNLTSNSLGGNK